MEKIPLDQVRENLNALDARLAKGEIGLEDYHVLVEKVCSRLTAGERERLGLTDSSSRLRRPLGLATENPDQRESFGDSREAPGTKRLLTLSDLKPGARVLRQWRVTSRLGEGGFAAVFEATEIHLGGSLALKVLKPSLVSQDEELRKFRGEAALMRQLVHPNVVRVFDYREDREHGLAALAMELVRGPDLRELLELAKEREELIPAPLALALLESLLGALAETHGKGGVHGDVKPENVLLAGADLGGLLERPTADPKVKVIDFGLGGAVPARYMAPELAKQASPQGTVASDLYGVGAVAYEVLTGSPPVGRFPVPSQVRDDLPEGAEELLLKLLAPTPARRGDAAAALKECESLADQSHDHWKWENKWQWENKE